MDEIGHNPYELASYLSAKYHVYFREQVQDELREIFEAQYELTLTEEVEIRYRTETSTDPETGETTTEEVPYEYYILTHRGLLLRWSRRSPGRWRSPCGSESPLLQ